MLVDLWLQNSRKRKWKKDKRQEEGSREQREKREETNSRGKKWKRRRGRTKGRGEGKKKDPPHPPKHNPITTNITGYLHPTFLCTFAHPEGRFVEAFFKPFMELCVQRKTVSLEVLSLVCVASVVL